MAEQLDILAGVAAVARRHGVDPAAVREVAGGVANRGFVLGENLFLRVCRLGFEPDLLKETHVVPAARSAGVLTPAIVEYDATHHLIDAPYAAMERIHGTEPTNLPTALAEQLAHLHQLHRSPHLPSQPTTPGEPGVGDEPGAPGVRGTPGLPGVSGTLGVAGALGVSGLAGARAEPCLAGGVGLGEEGWGDPWRTVEELGERGYVDLGTAGWLSGWFTRLAERVDRSRPKVLIHGDVAAHNLLAGPDGELRALIDWGDAAWAPRAMEFAKLPLAQVAVLLPDYLRHAQPPESEEELAAGVLWFHLSWAIAKLSAAPWPGQRHWTAPTASRLLSILHFFTTAPPAPWSGLT